MWKEEKKEYVEPEENKDDMWISEHGYRKVKDFIFDDGVNFHRLSKREFFDMIRTYLCLDCENDHVDVFHDEFKVRCETADVKMKKPREI